MEKLKKKYLRHSIISILIIITSYPVHAQAAVGLANQSGGLSASTGDRAYGCFDEGYSLVNSTIRYYDIHLTKKTGLVLKPGSLTMMTISPEGSVVMGTPSSVFTNKYLLSVTDTMVSKGFIITASGWPDYVFETGYKLPPLNEVKKFIEANNHLPGIPSQKEVEENGIDVAVMATAQMQKIEELTLYLIQQQKKIDLIEKKIEQGTIKVKSHVITN